MITKFKKKFAVDRSNLKMDLFSRKRIYSKLRASLFTILIFIFYLKTSLKEYCTTLHINASRLPLPNLPPNSKKRLWLFSNS